MRKKTELTRTALMPGAPLGVGSVTLIKSIEENTIKNLVVHQLLRFYVKKEQSVLF